MQRFHPIIRELAAGEHKICHCGESSEEPMCDEQWGPECRKAKTIKLEEAATVAICACGRSETMPTCDGSHGYDKKR